MSTAMTRALFAALTLLARPASAADSVGDPTAALIFYDASGNQSLDPAEPQSTSGLAQLPLIAVYD